MHIRNWTVTLLAFVLVAASVLVTAQAVMVRPVPPTVLSGDDVGLRIEGDRGGTPIGTIVVKQNGEWVEAEIGHVGQTRRLSLK